MRPARSRRSRGARDSPTGTGHDEQATSSPKYKICRRPRRQPLGPAPRAQPTGRDLRAGGSTASGGAKPSDFGVQLAAKQRLRGYYGNITEKQFRRYYHIAGDRKGDTGENLVGAAGATPSMPSSIA